MILILIITVVPSVGPVRRSYPENPTRGHPALGLEGRSPVRSSYPDNPTHGHPALGVEGRSPVLRSYPENPNEEDHPVVGRGVGSDDPNPEWSDHLRYAAPVNDWRDMFSEQITRILICLGTASGEALRLRESAGRLRYRVASAYAILRPQSPRTPESEARESTDSGLATNSSESEVHLPWRHLHHLFGSCPMYRANQVEEAWEAWLLCQRPWDDDLRTIGFFDRLFDIELIAFRAMAEVYYMRPPSSRGSETPRPPIVGESTEESGTDLLTHVFYRCVERGEMFEDQQGTLWSRPVQTSRSAARGSMDPMPDEHASSDSEPTEYDWAIARAAFTLYQADMQFDWEQLSESQQQIYHSLVGRMLQELQEVD